MRLCAGRLRGTPAGRLRGTQADVRGTRAGRPYVRGVRTQGEALRLQTADVLSQKSTLPDARCLLCPGPSLLFLCRTRKLSHGFPPNFGSALSLALLIIKLA